MGAAAAPILIGSAIGGLTNRKNPLQGALLGGALGGAGNAFMGAGGLSNMFSFADDAAGVLPSALSGSTTINAAAPMAGQAFTTGPSAAMQAANLATGPSGAMSVEAMKSAGSGLFAPPAGGFQSLTAGMPQPLTFNQATAAGMQRPLSLGMPGVEASSLYEPTFMDRVGSVGQYAQQNPVLTGMALQSAQQMMQRPEVPMAPAGQVSRGQIQGGDYMSLLNPQQSTVLRPQPISLLG
jgi:hypothetical protein